MKVIVEIITGTFIDTEVSENATVEEFKEKIAAEVKLPVKRLILVVGDEEERRLVMDNEDYMILRDLGVGESSHVYLFFKHPDMVSEKERSREGGDDDPMEKISSEKEEEEEKANTNGEEQDEEMKDEEEEDKDEKVEDGEKEEEEEEKRKKVKEENEENVDVKEEPGDSREET